MSQLWNIPTTTQTPVHFPSISATLWPPTMWNTCLAACLQWQWRVDICVSARSTSFLLRHDPSVQLGNGENKSYGVWITSGPEGGNVAWFALHVVLLTWFLSLNNLFERKTRRKKLIWDTSCSTGTFPTGNDKRHDFTQSTRRNKNKYLINAKICLQWSFFLFLIVIP